MIVCLAVGISNIFTSITHPIIIVFCALAM